MATSFLVKNSQKKVEDEFSLYLWLFSDCYSYYRNKIAGIKTLTIEKQVLAANIADIFSTWFVKSEEDIRSQIEMDFLRFSCFRIKFRETLIEIKSLDILDLIFSKISNTDFRRIVMIASTQKPLNNDLLGNVKIILLEPDERLGIIMSEMQRSLCLTLFVNEGKNEVKVNLKQKFILVRELSRSTLIEHYSPVILKFCFKISL